MKTMCAEEQQSVTILFVTTSYFIRMERSTGPLEISLAEFCYTDIDDVCACVDCRIEIYSRAFEPTNL